VFYSVADATYEELLDEQIERAIHDRGAGDLKALFNTGDTYTVSG